MNIFDIIGPVMIGPSSSHTAGAVRIGKVSLDILGEPVVKAEISLSGSFAKTGKGHGTDRAIIAGLLGMMPDDSRIPNSFDIAKDCGLEWSFSEINLSRAHPNTAKLFLVGKSGKQCKVQGASVGGGNILITNVNDMETAFTGISDTLIIPHKDVSGMIASVTTQMAFAGINIGNFKLNRPHKGFQAVMTLEIDGTISDDAVAHLAALPHIESVVLLHAHRSEAES
ncbi:MAG: L-serine ammonia-lyase, iron-sulfur-dependent subunit beta [Termitinemataceae bacterium]|nr:MAG: L-serine ammonia-lyase, iron-sulfur-dependent subunit beta [Termitinemataceae bacterium]